MSSAVIHKVFVSSTLEDLREERGEAQRSLLQLGCLPVGMELFPSADEETWDFIKRQIDGSDYYVLIIGGRYGSLAADGISFTEKEYDYARERGIPSIAFIHRQEELKAGKMEKNPESLPKLEAFIKKVQKRPCSYFTSPHELAREIAFSYAHLRDAHPREGFIRANSAIDGVKYADLLERYSALEKRLAEVEKPSIDWAGKVIVVPGTSQTVELERLFPTIAFSIIDGRRSESEIRHAIAEYVKEHFKRDTSKEENRAMLGQARHILYMFNLIDTAVEGTRGEIWIITPLGRRVLASG
jgi:hypothetical protein